MKTRKKLLRALLAASLMTFGTLAKGQTCVYASEDCNICPSVTLFPVPPLICPGGPSTTPAPTITMPPGLTLRQWSWSPSATASPASGTTLPPGMTTFTPATTTTYTLSVEGMGPNILADGDFSGWTGWGCFFSAYTNYTGSAMPSDHYAVGTDPALFNSMFYSMTDHTGGTSPNMLVVNSGPLYSGPPSLLNPVWMESEIPVCKDKDYAFTAWYANLEVAPDPFSAPQIQVVIKDAYTGLPIYTSAAYYTTGIGGTWNPIDFTWSTGASTLVNVFIYQVNTNYTPVDFALDDISLNRVCTGTGSVTFNVDEIAGPSIVCENAAITLTTGSSGGVWASDDPSIAMVDPLGVVTGVTAGVTIISYYSPLGCVLTKSLTVNPAPAALVGDDFICSGDLIVMTSATPGGTWSSSPWWLAYLSLGPSIGHFYTYGPGVVTISYTAGGCITSKEVTINPTPYPIGMTYICQGFSTTLSAFPAGGTWTCSPAGVATITPGGLLTGVGSGMAVVTYTTPEGCFNTGGVEVIDCGAGGYGHAILPFGALCQGSSFTPTLAFGIPPGGVWALVSGTSVTIDPITGLVTGVGPGVSTISYTVGGITYLANVTVIGAITPCVVSTLASPSGFTFTGVPFGSVLHFRVFSYGSSTPCAYPSYTVTSTTGSVFLSITDLFTLYGCSATISVCLDWVDYGGCRWYSGCCAYLNPGPKPGEENQIPENKEISISIIPNPNNGSFTLSGTLADKTTEGVIEIMDLMGKVVYSRNITAGDGKVDERLELNRDLANGLYIARVKANGTVAVIKFEVNR